MAEETEEFTRLFQEFLIAHADPDGGLRLHALFAEDAYVLLENRLVRKGDTDEVSFADSHRRVEIDGDEKLPVFEGGILLAVHVENDGSHAVGWFETREITDDQRVTVACGFRFENRQWHIGWCVVSPSSEGWSYREGLLQTLAEYQWVCSDQSALLRSSIDASYIRLYRPSDDQLSFLPEARFNCHMTGSCCKADFGIVWPAAAQTLIDALPWEVIRPELKGTRLEVRSDGQLQLKNNHETCRFLNEHGQCLIHKTLGRQPFRPCAVFPFAFAKTPTGMAVSTSYMCGSVRHSLGPLLSERQDVVRERLFLAKALEPDGFRLAPGLTVSWEVFAHTENVLLDLLGETQIPLYRRLYVGNRVLDALRKGRELTIPIWLEEPLEELTGDLQAEMKIYFARILTWDRLALKKLPQDLSWELRHGSLSNESLVAAILKNLLFSKVYSYPFSLSTAHNMAIVLYVLTLAMQSVFDEGLPDDLWRELAALGGHGLLKSLIPDSAPQSLVEFLGSSEFGQWALWYPQK